MSKIKDLADAVKKAVDNRIANEARARRGSIQDGMFQCGSKAYPFKQAVDCNTNQGARVWCQLDNNGNAVIVGA